MNQHHRHDADGLAHFNDLNERNTLKKLIAISLTTVAFAAGLTACSDPKNTPLPTDITKMQAIQPVIEKLKPEDKEMLTGYLMRRTFAGLLPGVTKSTEAMTAATIGQAIDQQRTFISETRAKEAAEKEASEKAKLAREAATKALRDLVSISLISKEIKPKLGASGIELDRVLIISFSFKNNSSKDISGVKGRVTARDLFGDEMSAFQISNDGTIKTGGSSVWNGSRSVQFSFGSNKDEKFGQLEEGKYTLVWEPQVIVFADGTKAEAK